MADTKDVYKAIEKGYTLDIDDCDITIDHGNRTIIVRSKDTRRMEQEKLEAEMNMLKWCLSRTSMDELKERWRELVTLKKGDSHG